VARGEPGRFGELLSAADAERLVTEPGLRTPGFRLVKAGARLDARSYTTDVSWRPQPFTGTAQVGRVLAEFQAGATIVLQGLHLNRLPVARWCRSLEALLGHPVQANAYWTPRDSQGLPVHHDTHDVFVLQLDGSKRWLVYEPVLELPLRDQRYSPDLGAPGEVVLDVTLCSGDTLYLPRGWLHEALTSDEDSLHLTVGVNVRTWLDALRTVLAQCGDDTELRRAVPADGSGAAEVLERVAERFGADSAAAAVRARFVSTRRPILDGQPAQLRALEGLRPGDEVERRDTVIADFDGERLSFEGKTLRFPPHAREEVEALVAAEGPVRLSELPGRLDDEGRLVLARRLVREGFLRIAGVR
jgi:bifunctional lysine-specific demethylase and histidyl-hydroxylase NO66